MSSEFEIKDLVILIVGLAGGFAGNAFFFKKSLHLSTASEEDLNQTLSKTHEQILRNGIRDATILDTIKKMKIEVEPLSDLVEIKEKMDFIYASLPKKDISTDDILRFKALSDRWSDLASIQFNIKILNTEGKISLERLQIAHKSIFPENSPWAGELRKEHVYIIDTIGTVARIVDLAETESKTSTISPDRIPLNLENLFNHWNSNIKTLVSDSGQVKISEVAHFHHELEMIHPFTDGNGRIGRMLLEEQLAILFNKKIKFRPEREKYYKALRMLDLGSSEAFIEIIQAELEKFNVSL